MFMQGKGEKPSQNDAFAAVDPHSSPRLILSLGFALPCNDARGTITSNKSGKSLS